MISYLVQIQLSFLSDNCLFHCHNKEYKNLMVPGTTTASTYFVIFLQ